MRAKELIIRLVTLIPTAFLSSACFALNHLNLPKPQDRSHFASAMLAPDRKTGVFVFKREIYRPGVDGSIFTDYVPGKYLKEVYFLGVYDLETGKIKILNQQKNKGWKPGTWGYAIYDVCQDRALITECGDREATSGKCNHLTHYWLDLKTGKLAPFPIKNEIERRGLEFIPYSLYLLDAEGTFLIRIPDKGPNKSGAETLWLRSSAAEYEVIANNAAYYGFQNTQIYFHSADRKWSIYSIEQRRIVWSSNDLRSDSNWPLQRSKGLCGEPNKETMLTVTMSSPHLQLGRMVNRGWMLYEINIDTSVFK